jgi:hypothetical protein
VQREDRKCRKRYRQEEGEEKEDEAKLLPELSL